MSEEANNEESSNSMIEIDAAELETMKATLAKQQSELASLIDHSNIVLNEKKKEQEKRRLAEENEEKSARKKGDFEQLLSSSEAKNKELEDKYNNMVSSQASQRIQSEALKLAASDGMAEGDNVELLADFIGRRLKYMDGELKVIDKDGQLTVSTLDSLKAEFMADKKFAALITRTKAAGGSAAGNNRGSASIVNLSRSQFDNMSPEDKMAAMKQAKNGEIKLTD